MEKCFLIVWFLVCFPISKISLSKDCKILLGSYEGYLYWAHSHFPGWRFNSLIYKEILFCINGWRLNEINGLYDGPGKWECTPCIFSSNSKLCNLSITQGHKVYLLVKRRVLFKRISWMPGFIENLRSHYLTSWYYLIFTKAILWSPKHKYQ